MLYDSERDRIIGGGGYLSLSIPFSFPPNRNTNSHTAYPLVRTCAVENAAFQTRCKTKVLTSCVHSFHSTFCKNDVKQSDISDKLNNNKQDLDRDFHLQTKFFIKLGKYHCPYFTQSGLNHREVKWWGHCFKHGAFLQFLFQRSCAVLRSLIAMFTIQEAEFHQLLT